MRSMIIRRPAVSIAFLVAAATLAMAAPGKALAINNCDLSMSPTNVNVAWNQNFSSQQIGFTITKTKKKACSWAVTFSRGGASDYSARRLVHGSDLLPYQLYGDSALTQVLKELPEATSINDVIEGSFTATDNQIATATYYLSIPLSTATTPTYRPAGNYSDTVTLRLYEIDSAINPTVYSFEQTSSVTITTTMPKILDLSIVGSGGAFDPASVSRPLNFGTLTEGATLGFDLLVRSNAGYQVTISSQNNGVMKHSTTGVTTTVPYTFTVNGTARSLVGTQAQPVSVASGGGQTSTSGIRNPGLVTIGSLTDRVAGDYTDNITVTATTTE